MTHETAPPQSARTDQPSPGLEKNALGLLGASLVGVVIMAPSLALYANWGPMIPLVGVHGSLIFLIALIMTLPTAYSYAILSSRVPNAGSVFAWASRFLHPRAGVISGYTAVAFYVMLAAFEPPLIASIVQNLFGNYSSWLFITVVVIVFAAVLPVAWAGIGLSMGTAAILVTVEGIIVAAVIVTGYFTIHGAHLSLEPLNPAGIPNSTVLFQALVLGVLSFTGFDAVSTVAEETRTARSLVPRATLLSAIVTGIFWVVTSLLLSGDAPLKGMLASKLTPLSYIAEQAMGGTGRVLIDLMALEAGLAITLASVIGASRVVFALGRESYLPRVFGQIRAAKSTPGHAVTLVVVLGLLANLAVGLYIGWTENIYLWLANCIVFFGLIVYMFVNVSHVVYFTRFKRDELNVFRNVLVPIAGLAISIYYVYDAFFKALWNAGFQMGRSTVITAVITLVVFIIGGLVVRVHARPVEEV
jgi:putrescine importer